MRYPDKIKVKLTQEHIDEAKSFINCLYKADCCPVSLATNSALNLRKNFVQTLCHRDIQIRKGPRKGSLVTGNLIKKYKVSPQSRNKVRDFIINFDAKNYHKLKPMVFTLIAY